MNVKTQPDPLEPGMRDLVESYLLQRGWKLTGAEHLTLIDPIVHPGENPKAYTTAEAVLRQMARES